MPEIEDLWSLSILQLFEHLGEPLRLTYDPDNQHKRHDCPICTKNPNQGSHSVAVGPEHYCCHILGCFFRGSKRELVDRLRAKLAAEARREEAQALVAANAPKKPLRPPQPGGHKATRRQRINARRAAK
jgi:hypothetical protein